MHAQGYRVEKVINGKITRYLYEKDKVVLETDGSGSETAYQVYGTNLLTRRVQGEKAEQYYYLYNAHGDVTGLLDGNGGLAATYDYDAFGNLTSKTGQANNPTTYAGYQWDEETGLYYLNARYYDSVTARFITEDSYIGEKNDPLSLNLYTYCHNNPIIYLDPSGHASTTYDDYMNKKMAFRDPTWGNVFKAVWVGITAIYISAKENIKPTEDKKHYSSSSTVNATPVPAPASTNPSKPTSKVSSKQSDNTKATTDNKNEPTPGNPPKQGASNAETPPTGKEPKKGNDKKESEGESKSGGENKSKNKPKQQGEPNSVEYQRDANGNITKYTEYDSNGKLIKEVRITGKDHGDIPRPNVKEPSYNIDPSTGKSFQNGYKVRPAERWEIPLEK